MLAFFDKFNEPFPSNESPRQRLLVVLIFSLFIAGFLFLFRPFGVQNNAGQHLVVCLGFGFVTFFCMTSFEFLIPRLFRLEMDLPSWTLWKWIVYSLLMICWIAFGNILLIELLNPGRQLYWQTWLFSMVPQTLAIGVFPTTFYGLLIQMRASKKNQIEAERMDIVTSFGSKKKLTFALSQHCSRTLDEDQLLYVRSMQNYVALMYWDGEKVEKIIVRSTLQGLYKELSSQSDGIEQCHRSFLVNIKAVTAIDGNAQGLKLSLRYIDDMRVPVSRRFIDKLRTRLAA